MNIEHYSFGRIMIDGRTYASDVIIYPDRVDPSWWRKEGHKLHIEDLTDIVEASPEVLIIGTGYLGLMKVPQGTSGYVETRGVRIYIQRTSRAVDLFNKLHHEQRVVAALHLTC